GDTTSIAPMPITSLGWLTARSLAANERASDSGVREIWSTMADGPCPGNSETVDAPRANPRSTDSGSHGEPASSSAKQNVYFPGPPNAARSMPPGTPPPTLRTTSCSARPIVALARLPCPMQLTPLFMPICAAIGPFTTITGPEKYVVHRRPCMLNASVQAASTDAFNMH